MLEVHQLCSIRDERVLFEDLSFAVDAGSLVQIEGPNGAGKTTLLRILAGLHNPESGQVRWQQLPIASQREQFNRDLLFLGHHMGVKPELTAFENVSFYQKMHGEYDEARCWQALAFAGLAGHEDVASAQLSAGQHRRVALARLWITQAKLWILDEPFTAIDKQGVRVLEQLFHQHAATGGTVIFTTHQDMPSGQQLRTIRLGANHV